jgi:cytidyltransferase-like protein
MPRRRFKRAAAHGRFQPFQLGHWAHIQKALSLADEVIVGITSPLQLAETVVEATDDARHSATNNPFTYLERLDIILSAALEVDPHLTARLRIVPFDVSGPPSQVIPLDTVRLVTPHEPWDEEKARRFQAAGYRVMFLETRKDRITATKIRNLLSSNRGDWNALMPRGAASAMRRLRLDRRL